MGWGAQRTFPELKQLSHYERLKINSHTHAHTHNTPKDKRNTEEYKQLPRGHFVYHHDYLSKNFFNKFKKTYINDFQTAKGHLHKLLQPMCSMHYMLRDQ